MQERFKKVRKGWVEELLASLSSNSIIACEFAPLLRPYSNHHFKFDVKSSIRTLSPPEITIALDPDVAHNLYQKALRTRKTFHANLLTQSLDSPVTEVEELPSQLFEGEEENQEEGQGIRIGLAIAREEGVKKTKERIERELRRCSERSGAKFSSLVQRGRQSELWHLLNRLVRLFLIVEQREKSLKIARLLYYPKADLQIHKIKITPFSFIENEVLRRLKSLNFAKEVIHGYIALNRFDANSPFQFIMLQPHEFEANPVPLVGVFLGGKLGGQLKQDCLLWTVIMEYLSNPLATNKRLSLNGERTGFLFLFQEKGKNSNLQFEVPASARWKLSTSVQSFSSFPKDIVFPNRQVIIEQEREESEVESVQSKQPYPLLQPGDSISSRSYDEKDQEIAKLKSQLEYFKQQCAWLTQVVTSLSAQTAIKVPTLQMPYPISPPFQPIPPFPQDFAQHFYASPRTQQAYFPVQKEVAVRVQKPEKQFKIKDSKNISFAQQNSYEEQNHIGNYLLQDQQFQSPQFNLKAAIGVQKEVKPFEVPPTQPTEPFFQHQRKETQKHPPQIDSEDHLQGRNFKARTNLDYKAQKPPIGRINSLVQTDKYSKNIPQSDSNIQIKHKISNYQSSTPVKAPNDRTPYPPEKPVSGTKYERNQFQGQRSKALGSITPKDNAEVHKKYLTTEDVKGEKKEVGRRLNAESGGKEQGREQEGKEDKRLKQIVDSDQEDDELTAIIRNRKK